MTHDRRQFLGSVSGLTSALAVAPAVAGLASTAAFGADVPGARRFPIWPGAAPGAPTGGVKDVRILRTNKGNPDDYAWTSIETPILTVCPAAKPTGAAVLMIPGGGYARVAVGMKPSAISRWFASQGVTCFELLYRLAHDGWEAGPDTPLQDAQRAMRVIRANAATWSIDPANVGVIGFSAGGHLCGSLATRWNVKTYAPQDAADAQDTRPVVAGMFFPVVSMEPPLAHSQSRHELLGAEPSEALSQKYSLQRDVPATTPPVLLGHAADDTVVDCANSIRMFEGCRKAGIPSELHIIEKGGHGAPLFEKDGRASEWLTRFAAFARRHGLKIPSDFA
ncbi:alpha/beta hydrolase [Novosphingobium sp. 1949]|uniref:Alpha/beta hydrolase n=1 Tax=Novosphingobium organovorum TaxID=2930092 RepID=A0ABT0BCW9_9SPHN|nr:alpha/beta hydrolase [Novosphingobium organovorum]MCJ2182916.1 alpha/beta hydrolase [Novosphingobium organovorum]